LKFPDSVVFNITWSVPYGSCAAGGSLLNDFSRMTRLSMLGLASSGKCLAIEILVLSALL